MNSKLRAMWLPGKLLLTCFNVDTNKISILVLLPSILIGHISVVLFLK